PGSRRLRLPALRARDRTGPRASRLSSGGGALGGVRGTPVRAVSMRPVGLEDILGRERYGADRDAIRRRVIEHKRARRLAVGGRVTLVFEDRATVWYQTQEMLWVEHTTDLDAIRAELVVYNGLLPGADELSATLLVEIEDQGRIREELERLIGIDEHVALV